MAGRLKELRMPVPDRRSRGMGRNVLRISLWVVLGALAVGMTEATQVWLGVNAAGGEMSFVRAMKVTIPSWLVLAALAPLVFAVAWRFPLFEGGRRINWLIHLMAAVVFSLLSLLLASWFSDYLLRGLPGRTPFLLNFRRVLTQYATLNLFTYAAFVGAWHAWVYSRRLRERERHAAELAVRTSRLETSLTNAKLESLRMQLNPHFLFNTLNTISVLAMKGERSGVTRIVGRLSELLRLSLDHTRQLVPLAEELRFLDGYIEIEEVRFRDRLTVIRDVTEDALGAEVPSLLLQPLVENAIRHGVGRSAGGGQVFIRAAVKGGRLHLEVRDSGPGFAAGGGRGGSGIGLENTRARLEELYGPVAMFEFGDHPAGGAFVKVAIPFRKAERGEPVAARRGA
ncbi:MAG TPA: histidine kinase [Longimicrobiales bacterium]|nr:histidine kinase [Longimicrobiales bacterium]